MNQAPGLSSAGKTHETRDGLASMPVSGVGESVSLSRTLKIVLARRQKSEPDWHLGRDARAPPIRACLAITPRMAIEVNRLYLTPLFVGSGGSPNRHSSVNICFGLVAGIASNGSQSGAAAALGIGTVQLLKRELQEKRH